EIAKASWTDLVRSFEGPSDTKENMIMDLKLEYQTFRAKSTESLSQTYTRYKTLLNELSNDGVNLSKHKINDFQENFDDEVDERSSEEYLRDLDIEYHERALLANSERFIKRRNNFSGQKANENTECYKCGNEDYKAEYKKMKAKLALLEASPSSSQNPKAFQPKNKGFIAETFDWDEEESHAHNGEWVDITIRKVNTLLSMDEDANWQTYLKYINIDLNFVKEKRLNLLSKYNKMVFELNKCRDEVLILKQAKLDAVTFQIQNTKLTNEQVPHQKKKVLGGELFTESSSKINENENIFIPASIGYDQEMDPKTKDWVERLNPDSKLPNFNTRKNLVPESQAVNESLESTETLNTPKSSKDSEDESLTLLPPLKNL
ncbi:hypothetical protein Tco_1129126, partial [Tanacetum coccineum]